MDYNNKEFSQTDLRRYVNMELDSNFYGKSEEEIYRALSKDALVKVMLSMIKETTLHVAMFAGCPCNMDKKT